MARKKIAKRDLYTPNLEEFFAKAEKVKAPAKAPDKKKDDEGGD